ncbi:MAG: co-chaperone GroES [Malacoplasma sp.]|nr:co-chaperone GroES [Malacoplasma sp.]
MEFKPIGKRVLLKKIEKDTKSKGGVLLTQNANNERPSSGLIKAVGDSVTLSQLTIGTIVYFKQYKANEIVIDDQEYLVVEEDDILGIARN